jgi:hypothetical protein
MPVAMTVFAGVAARITAMKTQAKSPHPATG